MSATDELRRLLDERGVEYTVVPEDAYSREYIKIGNIEILTNDRDEVAVYNITPEQAVDATLGRGTCSMGIERTFERIDGDEEHLLECSECGSRRWWLAHMMPSYCPNCGRKVIG